MISDYGVSIVLLFLKILSDNRNPLLRFSSLPKNQRTWVIKIAQIEAF